MSQEESNDLNTLEKTMATQNQARTTLNGMWNGVTTNQFPDPFVLPYDPTVNDQGQPGQGWLNPVGQTFWNCGGTDGAGGTLWIGSFAGGDVVPTLTVTGAATIGTTLTVGGQTSLNGNTVIDGTLITSGQASLNSLAVTNDTTVGGDLTVTGTATFNGDFDLTSGDAITLTSTHNGAGAIALIANGGAAETILIQSAQGTTNTSLNLDSAVGGVTLTSGVASVGSITLHSANAAGGITLDAGSAGIQATAGNGLINIQSGTAATHINTAATANVTTIGNVSGASQVVLNSGTAGLAFTATNGPVAIASGTGLVTLSADAAATTINIGTGAAVVKTISIGGTGANVIAIGNTQTAGSIAMGTAMTGGTISIGGTGANTGNFDLAPGTGAQTVTLANAAGVKTLNIANGITGNTVSLGNGANAGAQIINIAGGASAANSTLNILSGNGTAGVQTANILTGNRAGVLNLGTGTAAHVVSIGSATGAAQTVIQAGTAGLQIAPVSGNISINAALPAPVVIATVVSNTRLTNAVFTGFTTAAAASQVFTFTNNLVVIGSVVMATVSNYGTNDAQMCLTRVQPRAGSCLVTVQNFGAAALNGDIAITLWVLS